MSKKFYEDKTYLLMCEKAEEIQKDHSIKKFDLFQDSNSKAIFSYDDNMMRKYIGKWIWLPRQDQLQGMILDFILNNTDRFTNACGLSLALNDWLHRSNSDENHPYFEQHKFSLFHSSLEIIWLLYLMKEKFNKTWISEENNWV